MRGKLTALPGMRVIALEQLGAVSRARPRRRRRSGASWAWTTCSIGKVRWAKNAGGTQPGAGEPRADRRGDRCSTSKWQQPFDASLTDVFQVQADIAGQVAQALDVAIGSRQQAGAGGTPDREPGGV